MFPSQEIAVGATPLPLLCALSERRLPRPGRGVKTSPRQSTPSARALRLARPVLPAVCRPDQREGSAFLHAFSSLATRHPSFATLPSTTFTKRLQPFHSTSLSHFLFPLCFQRVAASLSSLKTSSSVFSMRCRLLRKNRGYFSQAKYPIRIFVLRSVATTAGSNLVGKDLSSVHHFHLSPLFSIHCKLFSHFSLHQNAATPLQSSKSELLRKQRRVSLPSSQVLSAGSRWDSQSWLSSPTSHKSQVRITNHEARSTEGPNQAKINEHDHPDRRL